MWFERRCHACGAPGPAVCDACLDALRAPEPGWSVASGAGGPDVCRGLFRFEGRGRDLVVALKYRNGRELGRVLGSAMAALVDPTGIEVVTWAPTSRGRQGHRGYDQSRLLAGGLAGALGLPCRALLRRRSGGPQTGRSLDERRSGPHFAARRPSPPGVVLVDDVATSGATLVAASAALRRSGAVEVTAVTAACTPRRHNPRDRLKTEVRSAENEGVKTVADRSAPPCR